MTDSQIRKSDKHVFLLGAGFSAGYGAPVMKGFMSQARRKYFALVAQNRSDPLVVCYEKMMVFQQECMRCSWAFNRDWDNIEELYTQADLLRLARYPNALQADTLCQQIAWTIWDVYREYDVGKHPPMNYVLESVAKHHWPVVITTNYDVLCEIGILGDEPRWSFFYPGFTLPWKAVPEKRSLLEEDATVGIEVRGVGNTKVVPVIKLHGSVNWFQYDKGSKLFATTDFGGHKARMNTSPKDVWVGISQPDFEKKVIKTWGHAICNDIPDDPTSAIIPPMLGKMSVSPTISLQWRSAIAALETAAHITIIGYSFPETDAFMTRLLAEGLKNNNGLEDITIVDIRAKEDWARRLERIFTPTLRQTKVKYEESDAKDFLTSLANAGRPKGTAAVYTSTPH